MGLTTAQRQANFRARKKGLPEPYGTEFKAAQAVVVEEQKVAESNLMKLLEQVKEFDATGKRHKSEARSLTKLVRLYFGQPEQGDADEGVEEETTKKKTKNKRPNPSQTKIQIQNTFADPATKGRRRNAENIDYETNEIVSFWRWLDLRDRARKDLFWLGRVLGNGFYRSVHQVICDQFVQKNFGGDWLKPDGTKDESRPRVEPMYFEGYTLDDFHNAIEAHHRFAEDGTENVHGRLVEMMLLDSRGFYKSTINSVDSAQWLLNCPDIRILIITGEYKLSLKFLGAVKKYFFLAEGQKPSAIHLLFPEYVIFGKDGTSDSPLECPARILKQDEPSLWTNSIVANLSGWHCDIKKGDDIVTDENSNSEEAREKLKDKYDGTDDLLDPHGFMDHIGTRYFTDDWYGMRLSPDKETGQVAPIQYYKRACWDIKPEYRDLPLSQLTPEMVTLNFPQRWGFNKLRSLLLKKMAGTGSDRTFRNQQMNEPTDAAEDSGFKISFTEESMRAHMYQRDAAPKAGETFIVWDWALSKSKTSDYSCGVVVRIYKNDAGEYAAVILEIVCNKWKYSDLALQIVVLAKKWGPKVTLIEASNGYEMLKDEITRASNKLYYQPYIYWKTPSNEENAKRNRIKSLEILLNSHRLHFVLGPWTDETIKQFCRYTGEKKNKGRKDDIPDGCSYILYVMPADARPDVQDRDLEEEKRMLEEQEKRLQKQIQYERYFGNHLQTNSQAPSVAVEPTPPRPRDPRLVIFGKNGAFRM